MTPSIHLRRGRVLAPVLLALLGAGCGDAGQAGAAAAPRERTMIPAKWSLLWRAGGAAQDSVLLFPITLLAADARHVYVPDAGAQRVAAFRVEDGSLAWTFGRRGRGPGEFSSFAAIATLPGGQVVVADKLTARLTVLRPDGTLEREISSPEITTIESFCPLAGGDYLVSTGSSEPEPLVLLSPAGQVKARYPVPWKELRTAPGITRQLYAASAGSNACVLALKLGQGFSVYQDGRFSTLPYVEPLTIPEAKVTEREVGRGGTSRREQLLVRQVGPSGISAAGGDTLAVPFVGQSEHAARIIDMYGLAPAAYAHSYLLPFHADGVYRQGDVHFVLRSHEGHPALYAIRMRPGPVPPASSAAAATARL